MALAWRQFSFHCICGLNIDESGALSFESSHIRHKLDHFAGATGGYVNGSVPHTAGNFVQSGQGEEKSASLHVGRGLNREGLTLKVAT